MSTVMPQGEMSRKAIAWISEQTQEGKDLNAAIEEAGIRFNLGPKEVEFLIRFFKEQQES